MKRRDVLELAARSLGSGAVLAACRTGADERLAPARAPSWDTGIFTPEQALALEDLAELIIPESGTPGARSAGVPGFIESVVRDVYDEDRQKQFITGLDAVGARARAAHGKEFHACTPREQQSLMSALVAECGVALDGPLCPFVRALRELTIRGFCTSKLGATRVLSYDPTPGEFQGCVPVAAIGKAPATR